MNNVNFETLFPTEQTQKVAARPFGGNAFNEVLAVFNMSSGMTPAAKTFGRSAQHETRSASHRFMSGPSMDLLYVKPSEGFKKPAPSGRSYPGLSPAERPGKLHNAPRSESPATLPASSEQGVAKKTVQTDPARDGNSPENTGKLSSAGDNSSAATEQESGCNECTEAKPESGYEKESSEAAMPFVSGFSADGATEVNPVEAASEELKITAEIATIESTEVEQSPDAESDKIESLAVPYSESNEFEQILGSAGEEEQSILSTLQEQSNMSTLQEQSNMSALQEQSNMNELEQTDEFGQPKQEVSEPQKQDSTTEGSTEQDSEELEITAEIAAVESTEVEQKPGDDLEQLEKLVTQHSDNDESQIANDSAAMTQTTEVEGGESFTVVAAQDVSAPETVKQGLKESNAGNSGLTQGTEQIKGGEKPQVSDNGSGKGGENSSFQGNGDPGGISEKLESMKAFRNDPVKSMLFSKVLEQATLMKQSAGQRTLRLRLAPENLGKLDMELTTRLGVVSATILAEDEGVKRKLQEMIPQLREGLAKQGVNIDQIKVDISFSRPDDRRGSNGFSKQGRAAGFSRLGKVDEDSIAVEEIDVSSRLRRMALNIRSVDVTV